MQSLRLHKITQTEEGDEKNLVLVGQSKGAKIIKSQEEKARVQNHQARRHEREVVA
jgi:hypothetical protein